jgi:hypothetical protein
MDNLRIHRESLAKCWVMTFSAFTNRIFFHVFDLQEFYHGQLACHGLFCSGLLLSNGLWRVILQFEPAPRRGEPDVTRRTPDYFLWCESGVDLCTKGLIASWSFLAADNLFAEMPSVLFFLFFPHDGFGYHELLCCIVIQVYTYSWKDSLCSHLSNWLAAASDFKHPAAFVLWQETISPL